jgi:hypothetical protein
LSIQPFFFLILDEFGQESRLQKVVQNISSQSRTTTIELPETIETDPAVIFSASRCSKSLPLPNIGEKCNVVLTPISKLLVHDESYHISGVFQALQKLKLHPNVKQIFAVASTQNIQELFIVKFLEHMADSVVTVLGAKHLRILTKKVGGQVTNKTYDYEFKSDEILVRETVKTEFPKPEEPAIDPEDLGTFKIGKLGQQELQAKNALQLPYEK